jgi:RNase P/RNase MRP subunit POP5
LNRKIKKYLVEISLSHDLVFEEVNALFLQSVGEAYGSIGSAYINDDGTILVAKSKDNGRLYLKHYIISTKMYQKINKSFQKLLQNYSSQISA